MMTELLPTSAVVFRDKIVQPWKKIPGQCFDMVNVNQYENSTTTKA